MAAACAAHLAALAAAVGVAWIDIARSCPSPSLPAGNAAVPYTLSTTNVTHEISLDEWLIDPSSPSTPTLVQTVTMPTVASGLNFPCTMPAGLASNDASGSMSISKSGAILTTPCFGVVPQVGLGTASFPASTHPRVVARILPDGTVDTSHRCIDCYSLTGSIVYSALMDDTSATQRYWISGTTVSSAGGEERA